MTIGFAARVHIEPLSWSFLMEQYLTVNDLWGIVTEALTD